MDDLLLQRDARRNGKDGSLDLRRRQDKPADDPLCIASTSKAAAEIKIGSSALGHLDQIPSAPTRWFGSVPNAVTGMYGFRGLASIHHDLHAIAGLDLRVGVEAVEHAETLDWAVDAGHAVRQRFHGIARLRGDYLDAQRSSGLDFFQG